MKKYSVMLAYPAWSVDWDGPDTFYTYVSAHTTEAAIEEARKECPGHEPEDLRVLLVIEGWHPDIKP